MARCSSCVELGLAFPLGWLGAFVAVSRTDSSEFVFLAGRATSLRSVRAPFFVGEF